MGLNNNNNIGSVVIKISLALLVVFIVICAVQLLIELPAG